MKEVGAVYKSNIITKQNTNGSSVAKKGSGVLESRMAPDLLTDQLEFARKSDNSNSLKVKFI